MIYFNKSNDKYVVDETLPDPYFVIILNSKEDLNNITLNDKCIVLEGNEDKRDKLLNKYISSINNEDCGNILIAFKSQLVYLYNKNFKEKYTLYFNFDLKAVKRRNFSGNDSYYTLMTKISSKPSFYNVGLTNPIDIFMKVRLLGDLSIFGNNKSNFIKKYYYNSSFTKFPKLEIKENSMEKVLKEAEQYITILGEKK